MSAPARPVLAPGRYLEIVPSGRQFWRWRFIDPAAADAETGSLEPFVLPSNTAYLTVEEAARAAQTAYPDLLLHWSPETEARIERDARRSARWRRLRAVVVTLLVLVRLGSGAAGRHAGERA